ncbi:19632_t:CDS:2 [Dentiscutata erythropus]|uniref:19632_t:CDS:1 n=1 Tax=Dentiscutata erythropus TaxID=1348616 RepID=A0A9N9I4N7_9GLOM|nr:19632_t:CDS:2 [Dentiscutata erythropus]
MKKNESPCSIQNCSRNSTIFRKITLIAYKKAQTKGTLKQYDYLEIRQEICYSHYLDIVKPDRHLKKKPLVEQANIIVTDCNTQMLEANIDNNCNTQNNGLTFADQIQILTKVLYKYQCEKPGFIKLSPYNLNIL